MMDLAVVRLLLTAYRHRIVEPTVEAGLERLAEYAADTQTDFRNAVTLCVRDGLIEDPVRLSGGALQCHWRLALTEKGAERVRALLSLGPIG